MAHSKSSKRWLHEHFTDVYVKQAQTDGYRSRAAYKLLAIQERDNLIKPGMTVVDLGAAPGSWSQVVSQQVGGQGNVIAVDKLPMSALPNVQIIQGDFTEDAVLAQLLASIKKKPVDLVISDMAPNIVGNKHVDMPRAMYLVELVLDFCQQALVPHGSMLVKVFQGAGFTELLRTSRTLFRQVIVRKPQASRPRSKEIYLVAKDYIRRVKP